MPLISHCYDPAKISKPRRYNVPNDTNVIDWLNENFTDQDDLSGGLACSFILNGKEIFRSDHKNKDDSLIDFTISGNDSLIILNRPAGLETSVIIAIVAVVVSVAMAVYTYLSIPDESSSDSADTSPNGQLNAGSNSFRPYEAIPEVFGTGISYPDFLQPSYYYYEDNIKLQVGLFSVTVGEITPNATYIGTTNIQSISNSSATFYGPGEQVDEEYLSIHTQSSEVDGQVLEAYDADTISRSGQDVTVQFLSSTQKTVYLSVDDSDYDDTTFQYDTGLDVGDYIYIRSNDLNGVFEILEVLNTTAPYKVKLGEEAWLASKAGNTYTDSGATVGVGDGDGVIGAGTSGEIGNYIGWYELGGDEVEEVWINWTMPNGLRSKSGGSASVKVAFYIQTIVDDEYTGDIWSKTVTLRKSTADGQYQTIIFNKENTPSMPTGKFAFRAKRVTQEISSSGEALETIKLESVSSVTPYTDYDFSEITSLLVVRKATLYSADQSGKKINVDYTRKLPSYDRETGEYDEVNLVGTKSFADAVAYTLISAGNETTDTVDLEELYSIYDGLTDSDLGEFSATFDDADLSMGERVSNICKAARVISYHDGNKWRFSRDEAKTVTTALFNRRSTVGNQSKQSWQPQRSDDSDSVRVIYVDPDDNTEAYIDRAFDADTGEIVDDEVGANLKEITLTGCRNITQATNRADLEIRRLAYQRRSVTEVTSREALNIELLDRVGWVDPNDVDTFDGEIMGIDGDTYDTSERFEPIDGEIYVVFITDDEGYPSNTVQCFPRDDTEFGFTATGIADAYVAAGEQQIGSRYMIANANDLSASYFTMTSRTPNDDGTVTIELAEYRSEMYEKDGIVAASSSPIIPVGIEVLDVAQDGGTATATVTFTVDGLITYGSSTSLWYSDGDTSSIGSLFEIRSTIDGVASEWSDLSADKSWSVTDELADESPVTSTIEFEVRQIDYPENYASGSILLIAASAEDVSLPSYINAIDLDTTLSSASIALNSDGSYSINNGDEVGYYTTNVSNIGKYYEAMATQTATDGTSLSGSNLDTWITLSSGGADWSIISSTGGVSDLTIQVREIADTSNTATSSVVLFSAVEVDLPDAITYASDTDTASITFSNDGTYTVSGGETGTYFTSRDNIGDSFEVSIEVTSGETPTGSDEWVTIDSDVTWSILADTEDVSTEFTVSIRQIANNANIDSSIVTLSATYPII